MRFARFMFSHAPLKLLASAILLVVTFGPAHAQSPPKKFHVIAFFTGRADTGHISFESEANRWFANMAKTHPFTYDSTKDWTNMNKAFLSKYQVVLFLDTRPDNPEQRKAFEEYMKNGGAWMGFHFAGFALTPSEFPQDWDWYHNEFLGSGSFVSNTWKPTSAVLHVEDKTHPTMKGLPEKFKVNPNEWYRWENDLRKNPDIDILLAIDSTSFPLGTGPKLHEIWHSGYYPVMWTNKKYKMIYSNMGHNDIEYHKTGGYTSLSSQFASPVQNKLWLNCLLWLGTGSKMN